MIMASSRDFLLAQIAATEALLSKLGADDVLERMGLQGRLEELTEELKAAPGESAELSGAAVYFDGDPVRSHRGIDAKFAAESLSSFQDLVSTLGASNRYGPLKGAGPLPDGSAFRLFVTKTVQGSFGFQVASFDAREEDGTASEIDAAIDGATELLAALQESEEVADEALAEVDQRAAAAALRFVKTLSDYGASIRVRTARRLITLDQEQIRQASTRGAPTVEKDELSVTGVLTGLFAVSRLFELNSATGELLKGKLAKHVDVDELKELEHRACSAVLLVTTFSRANRPARRTFELLSARAAPHN